MTPIGANLPNRTTANRDLALVCPVCRTELRSIGSSYVCEVCNRGYPLVDDIPILLPNPDAAEHDEINHVHGMHRPGPIRDEHKIGQADHFDHAVAEGFEIERPHGTPQLYQFLLNERFRRAVLPIRPHLIDATALTVCGGSGMDAEFLARAGARVVSSDISLGAARRTRERARRHGVHITPIVADVEHLPFADRSFDLVFIHDGLHHLERPDDGLAEMTRVASKWVSVNEPARAAATALAVRAGIAKDTEEAGNAVKRLTTSEVVAALVRAGFQPVLAQRYAMYYRHQPGPVFRALSARFVFSVVRASWRLGNALIGRFGNKMVVVAAREAA